MSTLGRSNNTTTLITTHTSASQYYGDSGSQATNGEQKEDSEDKCRNTTKILAFSTFLIALSVGGYFTADLLANKGESVKLQRASNKQSNIYDMIDDNAGYWSSDLSIDIRPQHKDKLSMPSFNKPHDGLEPHYGYNNGLQQIESPQSPQSPQSHQAPPRQVGGQNGDLSMMKVINCDQDHDYSDDKETYQSDIRAVANYLKTYWISYSASVSSDTGQDPTCLQDKFEQGEVVCKDVQCVYNGDCVWKTEWDAIGICKYYYFDIGTLKHQERADRRACIASMLVQQWSQTCFQVDENGDPYSVSSGSPPADKVLQDDDDDDEIEEDAMHLKMKAATFKWWKTIFTVSDDWELDDCPCS